MYFLGIDMGGTVTKAGIYDALGNEICVSEKYAAVLTPHPGFTERNMDELWSSVCTVIQAALHTAKMQIGLKADQIQGIGFSSHGKGLYAINKAGNPVRNGIISSDTRALKIVQNWQEKGIHTKSYAKSLQQLWTGQPVSLLAWIKAHEPENYAQIDAILMVHDYVRFKMTGEVTAEITNISSSNLYNQSMADYDSELMALFDLEDAAEKTAPIVGSSERSGSITETAAQATGLTKGTPVYGGLFDVVAASISSGVSDQTKLSAVAGTWSIATTVLDELTTPTPDTLQYPYIWGKYCTSNQYFVHEGSPTSASNLAWMIKQFFQTQGTESHKDHEIYQKLNEMLTARQSIAEFDKELIFLPYLFGSNQALNLKAGFYGIGGHHTQDDLMAALYRGIVYSHLIHQDRILKLNPQIDTIRFTGGPSQSTAWMQMYTDAGGLPLEVVDIKQAGCKAAAMCASVGSGHYASFSEAIAASLPKVILYQPNTQRHDQLRAGYEKFLALSTVLAQL